MLAELDMMRNNLLVRIDGFCKRTGTAPTRFGAVVLNDPSFVAGFRDGLDVRLSTYAKVMEWLKTHELSRRPLEAAVRERNRKHGKSAHSVDRASRGNRKASAG